MKNLTKHQARAYSGRGTLNRAQREAFRGKSQVGGNPENPGFYPALRGEELGLSLLVIHLLLLKAMDPRVRMICTQFLYAEPELLLPL